MSLNTALHIAQNSLGQLSRQTATVARNINESGTADYVRREAVLANSLGGARVHVVRAQLDAQLVRAEREALSAGSAQTVLASGLRSISTVLGSPDGEGSVHQAIGQLTDAVQVWSSDPSGPTLAASTADAARTVAARMRGAAQQLGTMQGETARAVAEDVSALNALLSEFQASNAAVITGMQRGVPDLDALDTRDRQLQAIGRLVDVTTVPRGSGDLMVLTRDGTTLFETVPRQVGFTAGDASTPAAVSVDGVPLRAAGAASDLRGTLSARLHLLNGVLPDAAAGLDGVAQGLVTAFSETATGLPDADGLFTTTGGDAKTFGLTAAYDPAAGGDMALLRDGGANGGAYLANVTGAAGFSGRLAEIVDRTGTAQALALDQAGWVDGLTADASREAATREAVSARITGQLEQASGVDIDAELTRLLELERGYEASARMLSTADSMLATLLQMVH